MRKTQLVALAVTLAVPACLLLGGCNGSKPAQSGDANANNQTQQTQQTQTTDNKSQTNAQSTNNNQTQQTQTQTQTQTQAAPAYIGEDAAKNAALNHAGFAAGDVSELKAELDTDDGTVHYDVEFKQGGKEYDYDINATTGEIMKAESKVDD